MSEILRRWLNEELSISKKLEKSDLAKHFASGYLLGEVFNLYQLQDDFESFSRSKNAESKLNNFTRLEPVYHLLGIPFDTNVARDVMAAKRSTVTRLLYQMYIALNNKKKSNLTSVAMETQRPAAPAKLQTLQSVAYANKLKQITTRQTDVNLDHVSSRFHGHQTHVEEREFCQRFLDLERQIEEKQKKRQSMLERSRLLHSRRSEVIAKIRSSTVTLMPLQLEGVVKVTSEKAALRKAMEKEESVRSIADFEDKLNMNSVSSEELIGEQLHTQISDDEDRQHIDLIKPSLNYGYINKIRKRLNEDACAREEREKRRRKVMSEQLLAHYSLEDAKREDAMVVRMMRQSVQERRIAVQLLHARHVKDVIRSNRILREQQYHERRIRDYEDALNRETELARLRKEEYWEQLEYEREQRVAMLAQRRADKYRKHYDICRGIMEQVVEFVCKVAEYRVLTGRLIPQKLMREWKMLFINGYSTYGISRNEQAGLTAWQMSQNEEEEERQMLLDEGEFIEFTTMEGDWEPPDGLHVATIVGGNPVIGHIVHRLHNIAHPTIPPPLPPEFPHCPVKACFLGKVFSGKTSAARRLAEENGLAVLNVERLVRDAIQAHRDSETTQDVDVNEDSCGTGKITSSGVLSASDTPSPSLQPVTTAAVVTLNQQCAPSTSSSGQQEAPDSSPPSKSSCSLIFGHREIHDDVETSTPSLRNQLGLKALEYLNRGRVVDDQLVVEMLTDHIRRLPHGCGWVIDGYPQNVNQAKLLEKALTGYDPRHNDSSRSAKNVKSAKPFLVSNPHPSPPPPSASSGIDVVFHFRTDDDICMIRALGRTHTIQSVAEYHEELNPPPPGCATGLDSQEVVVAIKDPANEREQIQARLAAFRDSWPKLEKWFSKFGILRTVDTAISENVVFLEIEKIFKTIVASKDKGGSDNHTQSLENAVGVGALSVISHPTHLCQEPSLPTIKKGGVQDPGSEVGKQKDSDLPESKQPILPTVPSMDTGTHGKAVGGNGGRHRSTIQEDGGTEEILLSKNKRKSKKLTSPKGEGHDKRRGSTMRIGSDKRSGSAKLEKNDGEVEKTEDDSSSNLPNGKLKSSDKAAQQLESLSGPEDDGLMQPSTPQPGSDDWEYVDTPVNQTLAEILSVQWDVVEKTFVSSCKYVFRQLRQERDNIYKYLYQIREDFIAFLKRPDSKQEFVSVWQREYNDVPDDMRDDEETRCELHQRADDLLSRLWTIGDERKQQAELERHAVRNDGWLGDHLGILSNHYITLMQSEVDRFQDSVRLLKDYYCGLDGQIPDELNVAYERIPLIELSVDRGSSADKTDLEASVLPSLTEPPCRGKTDRSKSPNSKKLKERSKSPKEGVTKSKSPKAGGPSRTPSGKKKSSSKVQEVLPEAENEENEKPGLRIKVPFLSRQGQLPNVDWKPGATPGKDKKEKKMTKKGTVDDVSASDSPVVPSDPDEKLIFEVHQLASSAVSHKMLVELEENAVDDGIAATARNGSRSKGRQAKKAVKGKAATKKGESSNAAAGRENKMSDSLEGSPAVSEDLTEEEKKRRLEKEKTRQEFRFALSRDETSCRARLDLIKAVSTSVIQILKCKAEKAYTDMYDWLGASFLREMECSDTLMEMVCSGIEDGKRLTEPIVLHRDGLWIDSDHMLLKEELDTVAPDRPVQVMSEHFTVDQLVTLFDQFQTIAPSGKMSRKLFVDTLETTVSQSFGTESIPHLWSSASPAQIRRLADKLTVLSDTVDWRRLMASLLWPIRWPTQSQLLDTLKTFRSMDQKACGRVSRHQFDKMELWFNADTFTPVECREHVGHMKERLFDLFADRSGDIDRLHYTTMLLYFCAAPDSYEGFLRALSVTSCLPMPRLHKICRHDNNTDLRVEECVKTAGGGVIWTEMIDKDIPAEAVNSAVHLTDLYKVLRHGQVAIGDSHRFQMSAEQDDTLRKLQVVYVEMVGDVHKPVPYSVLSQHPVTFDLIVSCTAYKALDLNELLDTGNSDHNDECRHHQSDNTGPVICVR